MKDHRYRNDQDVGESFPALLNVIWCVCTTIVLSGLSGCANSPYRYGRAENYHTSPDLVALRGDQIERGQARPVLDGIGWVIGIPSKIILWDHRVDNHAVSPETEMALAKYLDDNELDDVKVRVNQYAPREEWQRLVANKSVGAGWRYTLGTLTWVGYTILPGRVFGGDNYNPFTNTVNIYSDAPALALHEGGHAKDFSRRKLPGTYAAVYALVPFAPLYHEAVATNDALRYLRTEGTTEDEQEAYRLLYPAYGTYLGSAVGGTLITVVGGHIVGRIEGSQVPREREQESERLAMTRDKHARDMASRRGARPAEKLGIASVKSTGAKRRLKSHDESIDERTSVEENAKTAIQPAGHSTDSEIDVPPRDESVPSE
jgi:hypothetical protein